jgi:murein DD-endopeptidase MepM/ murein hydrolase activator NlpD
MSPGGATRESGGARVAAEKKAGWAAVAVMALVVAITMVCVTGCSSRSPAPSGGHQVTYVVARGDTLYGIARRFGVSVGEMMTANGIENPRRLRAGQTLIIPGRLSYASLGGGPDETTHRRFIWPVDHGLLSSGFGMRHGVMHDGVDIAVPVGTPVHAAASGMVIYAGWLRGYGRVIIIRHDRHYVTVYAHDSVDLVRQGEHVTTGETIARTGTSGRTTGPNLHFEVRRNNVARNPLAYLPPPGPTAGISFARSSGS